MMRTQRMNGLLRRLHRCARQGDALRTSDGRLLGAFVERRDEEAFARLVERHGPMVLGVCRRVLLGSVHDAEDAFQATFLVLARKAGSISRRELVGNWLYGVAYRTALAARTKKLRRMARERQIVDVAGPIAESPVAERELLLLLDRELSRLPDKYRVPVVLCELEGRGRKEVARQLRLPEGTLSSRLATARKLLAARLSRHGPALGAGVVTAALGLEAAAAGVPTALADATIKAAMLGAGNAAAVSAIVSANVLALTQGVIKAMFLTKLKTIAAWLLLIGVLSVGTAGLAYRVIAGEPGPAAVAAQKAQDQETDKERLDKALKQLREAHLQAENKLLRDQLDALRERLAASQAGGDGPPKKDSPLRNLLEERLAAHHQVVELLTKEYHRGGGSFDGLHRAQMALHNAELELAETDKQRLEILERIVAQAHRNEEAAARLHKAGVAKSTDVLQARIGRLDAEIALERAKAKATSTQK